MRYLLDERPDVDLQSKTVDAVQHDAIPQQLYPPIWYRVRVPNFGVPFEFSHIWEDGTLVEMPTFNHVLCMSAEATGQVFCLSYHNSVGEISLSQPQQHGA